MRQKQRAIILLLWLGVGFGLWCAGNTLGLNLTAIKKPGRPLAQLENFDDCSKPGDEFATKIPFQKGEGCWDYGNKFKIVCSPSDTGMPELHLDTHCYDFGNLPLNKLDTSFSLGISNTGKEPLTITGLHTGGTELINTIRVRLDSCEKTFLRTCMRLTRPGRFKLTVVVACKEPCLPDSFTLYATGVVPILNAEPERLDFAPVLTREEEIKEIVVRNVGQDTLVMGEQKISTSLLDSVFKIVCPLPKKIFPGDSSTMKIRFAPNDPGAYEGTLIIHSNSYLNQITQIALNGQGFRGPVLQPSFLTHSFESICPGKDDSVALEIRNSGNEPLIVDSLSSDDPVLFPAPAFADTLPPETFRKVRLEYRPRNWASTDTAQITIHARADTAANVVSLFGTTPQFPGIIAPKDTLRFAATPVFCRVDSNSITLINTSACSLYVDNISTQPSDIFVPRFAQVHLAPNEQKDLRLDFTPRQAGTFNGTLKLNYRFGHEDSVVLFGIGLPGANAVFDETSHDFGALCLQKSNAWSFKIKNTGYCTLDLIKIKQAWPEVFKVYPQQETIHPLEEQTFVVKFAPITPGNFNDTLCFETAGGILTPVVTLRGEGLAFELEADSSSLTFEEVQLESEPVLSFQLENHASHNVIIERVEFGSMNCGFSLHSPSTPFTLFPGEGVTVSIKFKPGALGDCIDTLQIAHDAVCAQDKIVLSGKGVAAILVADPLHNFGMVQVKKDSIWNFVLADTGNIALEIDTSTIDYPDSPFVVAPLPKTIAPDSQYSVLIKFMPQTLDEFPDSLVFQSNAYPNRRHVLQLRGIGIDELGPAIDHNPANCEVNIDAPFTIRAQVTDSFSSVQQCILFYRASGTTSRDSIEIVMHETLTPPNWESTIPASAIGNRGIEYWFVAQDGLENPSRHPATGYYSISVNLPNGLSSPQALHSGKEQSDYRMISVPLVMNDSAAINVTQRSNFGSPDDTVWRLFDYHNGNLVELTASAPDSVRPFRPGRAYWLITTKAEQFLASGASRTVPTSALGCPANAEFNRIALEPGWNMIANPFLFDIAKSQCSLASGNALYNFQQFEVAPAQTKADWQLWPDTLKPWQGYAFYSLQRDVLFFANEGKANATPLAKNATSPEPPWDWYCTIEARSGEHSDLYNFAGVAAQAQTDWDQWDLFDPPPIGNRVNVYFPHCDWPDYPSDYAGDFRPNFANGEIWEFEVKSNLKESPITLTIKNSVNFPSHFGVYLYDKNRQAFQNLRERADYTFDNLGELLPGRFELLIGTMDFVQSRTSAITNNLPDEIQLYQNFPNPFNQETIFSFYLPQAAPVTLKVFDILGREVRVLSDGQVWEQGRQFVRWDRIDHTGNEVTSGIYILLLQTSGFKRQQQITLIK